MEITRLKEEARQLWGDERMTLDHVVIALGVVYGDLCRQARAQKEQGTFDEGEVKKELGNLLFSLVRWCDDLGFDAEECIRLAQEAQAAYVRKHKTD